MGSPSKSPDPYLDPHTGVLKNLVGATTWQDLHTAEADLVSVREVQLVEKGSIPNTLDLTEVTTIHSHLFQDLYAWAGEVRTIDMRRGDGEFFAPYTHLGVLCENFSQAIPHPSDLVALPKGEFLEILADQYDQLNFIHPFRDGNGRTQRLFWSRFSYHAGWLLDWRPIHGEELNEASRTAREDRDASSLLSALGKCCRPLEPS